MTCIEPGQTSKKDEEALIKKNREPERLITLIINVGNSQNPKDIAETLVLSKNASDAAAPGLAATNDEHGIYQTMEGPNNKIKFNDRKLIVEVCYSVIYSVEAGTNFVHNCLYFRTSVIKDLCSWWAL